MTLAEAADGPWRSPAERLRDAERRPAESLGFFGVERAMSVVEVWPGSGWWTAELAPFLAAGGGRLFVAARPLDPRIPAVAAARAVWRRRFLADPGLYGAPVIGEFGPLSGPLRPAGAADRVLALGGGRDLAGAGLSAKFCHDARLALKPGGVLGWAGREGEAAMRAAAASAGLVFERADRLAASSSAQAPATFGRLSRPGLAEAASHAGSGRGGASAVLRPQSESAPLVLLRFRKPA